jgi:glutamine amidotransferase
MMIAIVNYNMGNLGSVVNAFEKIGAKVEIQSNPERLKEYSKLILPGVGAFGDAMEHLKEVGLDSAIKEFANSGKYILGTCLGMQLLFNKSQEFGEHKGLGLIDGEVVEFNKNSFDNKELKIPHMGWNEIFVQKDDKIFNTLPNEFYQYFVHSYHVVCDDAYAIGKTYYGYEFVSAVKKVNIYGFQPHPEKSHEIGLKILENIVKL